VRFVAQSGSYQHSSRLKQSFCSERLGASRSSVHVLSNICIYVGVRLKSKHPTQWSLNASCGLAQQYSSAAIFSLHVYSIKKKTGERFKTVITVGSRFATVRFTTIHFDDPCLVGPSTPDLWYTTFVTQASFSI